MLHHSVSHPSIKSISKLLRKLAYSLPNHIDLPSYTHSSISSPSCLEYCSPSQPSLGPDVWYSKGKAQPALVKNRDSIGRLRGLALWNSILENIRRVGRWFLSDMVSEYLCIYSRNLQWSRSRQRISCTAKREANSPSSLVEILRGMWHGTWRQKWRTWE